MRRVLVIGCDSFLGFRVKKLLEKEGIEVVGTSRRLNQSTQILDLANNENVRNFDYHGFDASFVAAAVTSQEVCSNNPQHATLVNVYSTKVVIRTLLKNNVKVLFPSTNLVLGGSTSFPDVYCPRKPLGLYAETKSVIEKTFVPNVDFTVIRLPKILDATRSVFPIWNEALRKEKICNVLSNVNVAPISLEFAARCTASLLRAAPGGIWHISGEKELTYKDIFTSFVDSLGTEFYVRVNPQINEIQSEQPVTNGGLNSEKTMHTFGFGYQSLSSVIQDYHEDALLGLGTP